jgi:hypothetical protein
VPALLPGRPLLLVRVPAPWALLLARLLLLLVQARLLLLQRPLVPRRAGAAPPGARALS